MANGLENGDRELGQLSDTAGAVKNTLTILHGKRAHLAIGCII